MKKFSPTICVTHDCNLNCTYCYQKHDHASMDLQTGLEIIDWCINNIPTDCSNLSFDFIGGEPLLKYDLIVQMFEYAQKRNKDKINIKFHVSTNGTVLTSEMKSFFQNNKQLFTMGLSLDGTKESHNINRCDSFDSIDLDFFTKTWPESKVKMTISEHTISHLSENIKFIHQAGFKHIGGVNLCQGNYDWGNEKFIRQLVPQLKELVDFYTINDHLILDQMFNRPIEYCDTKIHVEKKFCGIGCVSPFFDTDGRRYPCVFCTPMTFNQDQIDKINKIDFSNPALFTDRYCQNNCYIYPICPTCAASNFQQTGDIANRDKSRCRIQKLITLFSADLQAN